MEDRVKNERIKECLRDALGSELVYLDISRIQSSDSLIKLGLDSLNVIKLIVAIEDAFGIEFEDEDISIDNWSSIDSIIMLLNRRGV